MPLAHLLWRGMRRLRTYPRHHASLARRLARSVLLQRISIRNDANFSTDMDRRPLEITATQRPFARAAYD